MYLLDTGWERGVVQIRIKLSRGQREAEKTHNVHVLIIYVIDEEFRYRKLGGGDVSYLFKTDFDNLLTGESDENSLGVSYNTWRISKL